METNNIISNSLQGKPWIDWPGEPQVRHQYPGRNLPGTPAFKSGGRTSTQTNKGILSLPPTFTPFLRLSGARFFWVGNANRRATCSTTNEAAAKRLFRNGWGPRLDSVPQGASPSRGTGSVRNHFFRVRPDLRAKAGRNPLAMSIADSLSHRDRSARACSSSPSSGQEKFALCPVSTPPQSGVARYLEPVDSAGLEPRRAGQKTRLRARLYPCGTPSCSRCRLAVPGR